MGFVPPPLASIDIHRIVTEAGIEIPRYVTQTQSLKPNQTQAIGSLESCLRKYGEKALLRTLKALVAAYPETQGELTSFNIKAVCRLIGAFEQVDDAHLVEVLSDTDLSEVRQLAEGYRKVQGGNIHNAQLMVMLGLYNRGLRGSAKLGLLHAAV